MLSSVSKLKFVIIFTDHAVIFPLKIAQMITIVNMQWIGDGLSVLERLSHNWDYLDMQGQDGGAVVIWGGAATK